MSFHGLMYLYPNTNTCVCKSPLERKSVHSLYITIKCKGTHSPTLGARSVGSWTELTLGKEAEKLSPFPSLEILYQISLLELHLALEFDKHLHVWPFRKI